LDKTIFKEFEEIVGVGNIDDGEVVTQNYAFNWCMEIFNYINDDSPSQFGHVPKAVILPSSTEEIQAIIRLANKYSIKVKCHSTGLGAWSNVSTDNAILLDLRRMNKIIKIDVKNLYAVIEPYVIGAQLQAELMKYGLNCHMSGAGPQVSPLASHTSMGGPGFTSPQTSHSARNVLGVEWVLPTGEVLKLGSYGLKENPDWFSGDGPGPSLRGVMRGWLGALSGLGIFTKVGIKLFPYPCSEKFKVTGHSPNYNFEVPDYIKAYIIDCSTLKHLEESLIRIEEEEIAFVCSYMSSLAIMAIFSNSVESLMEKTALGSLKIPIITIITAKTKR
jgi:glycolate oxidase